MHGCQQSRHGVSGTLRLCSHPNDDEGSVAASQFSRRPFAAGTVPRELDMRLIVASEVSLESFLQSMEAIIKNMDAVKQ